MQAARRMKLQAKKGEEGKGSKVGRQTASTNIFCPSPSSYTTSIIPTADAISSTHPALPPPPLSRHALQQAILKHVLHSTANSHDLEKLWAQLRANTNPVPASYCVGSIVRRQLAHCRSLEGYELDRAVQELLDDLDKLGKWIEKWREKEE